MQAVAAPQDHRGAYIFNRVFFRKWRTFSGTLSLIKNTSHKSLLVTSTQSGVHPLETDITLQQRQFNPILPFVVKMVPLWSESQGNPVLMVRRSTKPLPGSLLFQEFHIHQRNYGVSNQELLPTRLALVEWQYCLEKANLDYTWTIITKAEDKLKLKTKASQWIHVHCKWVPGLQSHCKAFVIYHQLVFAFLACSSVFNFGLTHLVMVVLLSIVSIVSVHTLLQLWMWMCSEWTNHMQSHVQKHLQLSSVKLFWLTPNNFRCFWWNFFTSLSFHPTAEAKIHLCLQSLYTILNIER